jgi:secreted PhoX family phosphatase
MSLSIERAQHDDEFDPDDYSSNPSGAKHFAEIVEARFSRRSMLGGSMLAAAGFLTTSALGAPPARAHAPAGGRPILGFKPVPLGYGDEVVVPKGYTARPFIPWGTPILGSYPEFKPGGNIAEEQAQQVGMHHDGMSFFPVGPPHHANEHGVLVLNHEYTDEQYMHDGSGTRPAPETYTAEMVRKSQAAHGVSVVEVRRGADGQWAVVKSTRNRRITANTPMRFAGPAAGDQLVRTKADRAGENPIGTINNCGNGETFWNTYLTCEENFNGYFRVEEGQYRPEDDELLKRYGVGGDRYNWARHDERFVVTPQEANEPNRFGWIVEIDPFRPDAPPVKRTALGRFKHEDATVHEAANGHLVVYMGDDQRFEYAYKYVSSGPWRDMLARGRSPLDEGTLYVARYNEDGSGDWLPLVHGQGPLTARNGFADQGEVLVKTRLAADALGATPMDRPEWTDVDPRTGTVYLTLTNNTAREETNAANPRVSNKWGHIVRWDEEGGDHTATRFTWDLFLLAGPGDGVDGSTISSEDAFGSPDGMFIDPDSRVWIQTDGGQPHGANDQMLAADPDRVDKNGYPEIRRFLTGVMGCEVTGNVLTEDQRTLFVNIQHPSKGSTWPRTDDFTVPRSATVIVTKDDGGVIGT